MKENERDAGSRPSGASPGYLPSRQEVVTSKEVKQNDPAEDRKIKHRKLMRETRTESHGRRLPAQVKEIREQFAPIQKLFDDAGEGEQMRIALEVLGLCHGIGQAV